VLDATDIREPGTGGAGTGGPGTGGAGTGGPGTGGPGTGGEARGTRRTVGILEAVLDATDIREPGTGGPGTGGAGTGGEARGTRRNIRDGRDEVFVLCSSEETGRTGATCVFFFLLSISFTKTYEYYIYSLFLPQECDKYPGIIPAMTAAVAVRTSGRMSGN